MWVGAFKRRLAFLEPGALLVLFSQLRHAWASLSHTQAEATLTNGCISCINLGQVSLVNLYSAVYESVGVLNGGNCEGVCESALPSLFHSP